MDYKDYVNLNRQDGHFWFKARKIFIFKLLGCYLNPIIKERKILEIGCGTGYNFDILSNFGEVEGVDINKKAIAKAQRRNKKVKYLDVEKKDLNKKFYDVICCFDVLEHLNNDVCVLENIYKALKPGGFFFFTVPAFSFIFSPHDLALDHKRRYNKRQIKIELEKQGLQIQLLNYWNVFLFPFVFVLRKIKQFLFIKIFKNKPPKSETRKNNKLLSFVLFQVLNMENKVPLKIKRPFGLTIYGVTKK